MDSILTMNKLKLQDVDLEGKRVLVRADLNVPLNESGAVQDITRVKAIVPTIELISSRKPKCIIIISHLGRPSGRDQKLSLFPVAKVLSRQLNSRISFIDECVGGCVERSVNDGPDGKIFVLENIRFHPEEEIELKEGEEPNQKVLEFREKLTKLCDVYVNDAFGTAHRAHSSMVGISVPVRAMGLLMEKELQYLSGVMENPVKPFLAILGGAKVHDKIRLVYNLLDKVDHLIIAGGMAFTFLKVMNQMTLGDSLFDEEGSVEVESIVQKAREKGVTINLPEDFVCADKFDADAYTEIFTSNPGIQDGYRGMDIGNKTLDDYRSIIVEAKTIFWNGPVGVFEFEKFSEGTKQMLAMVSERTNMGVTTVLGGGDTASAACKFGFENGFSHISTGGGASLELLEGKLLPGFAALTDASIYLSSSSIRSSKKKSTRESAMNVIKTSVENALNSLKLSKLSKRTTNETKANTSLSQKKSHDETDKDRDIGDAALKSALQAQRADRSTKLEETNMLSREMQKKSGLSADIKESIDAEGSSTLKENDLLDSEFKDSVDISVEEELRTESAEIKDTGIEGRRTETRKSTKTLTSKIPTATHIKNAAQDDLMQEDVLTDSPQRSIKTTSLKEKEDVLQPQASDTDPNKEILKTRYLSPETVKSPLDDLIAKEEAGEVALEEENENDAEKSKADLSGETDPENKQ